MMKAIKIENNSAILSLLHQLPPMMMCQWQSTWYIVCSHQFSLTFGTPSQLTCGSYHYHIQSVGKLSQPHALAHMLTDIIMQHQSDPALADKLLQQLCNMPDLPQRYKIAGKVLRQTSDLHLRHQPQRLSVRETEVLQLIGQGLSMKSIAMRLDISPHTVNSYHKIIYRKLNAKSKIEALVKAQGLGLI